MSALELAMRACPCGATIGRKNRSGLCRTCVIMSVNERTTSAERSARWHRTLYLRPQLREEMSARCARMRAVPGRMENARRKVVEGRLWEKGVAARTPEDFAKAGRARTETTIGWCPPELRDEYRRLVKVKHMTSAEARAVIMAQHERDMARFRNRVEAAVSAASEREHG